MGDVRKAATCLCMVLRGMLFIGFSAQIVLGICWICCNFGQVQSFGEPESALYRGLLTLFGGNPAILYFLQLAAAFFVGSVFLQNFRPVGRGFALWRGMALVTMPFGMQCHLALLPYSFMGTTFMLFLLALLKIRKRRVAGPLLAAFACAVAFLSLSGAADLDKRERPGHSIEGALASRFAWPTLWNDYGLYGEEVRTVPKSVVWESTYYSGDMGLFQECLESQVGVEAAKECYLNMAKVGWDNHASMIIRQIGWDVLGYVVTPVIFPLQMAGEAYDSCSGSNYDVMRENAPVLTRYYVDYGCWWFVWMLVLSFFLWLFQLSGENPARAEHKKNRRKAVLSAGICCLISGLLVMALTMRGAGRMDYRESIAVNALWLMGPLLLMGRAEPAGLNSLAGTKTAGSGDISGRKGTRVLW